MSEIVGFQIHEEDSRPIARDELAGDLRIVAMGGSWLDAVPAGDYQGFVYRVSCVGGQFKWAAIPADAILGDKPVDPDWADSAE